MTDELDALRERLRAAGATDSVELTHLGLWALDASWTGPDLLRPEVIGGDGRPSTLLRPGTAAGISITHHASR